MTVPVGDMHPIATAWLAAVSSVSVGAILIGLRRALLHRDQTAQHSTEIAVLHVKLTAVEKGVSANGAALQRIEARLDSPAVCRDSERSERKVEK